MRFRELLRESVGGVKIDNVKGAGAVPYNQKQKTSSVFDSNIKLFHISFNGDLEGVWYPKNPEGIDSNKNDEYREPNLPRISVSPTIPKCFLAIYPNVSKYFEIENFPYMEFFVYVPILSTDVQILTPDELTERGYVHDAFITKEHCILDPVSMKKHSKIKIFNTNNSPFIKYHPFNDHGNPKRTLGPKHIKYTTIEKFI